MKGITRIEYTWIHEEIRPYRKTEMVKIDEHHYLLKYYIYDNAQGEFCDAKCTCWFDSEKLHNGVVRYTDDNVDTMFELKEKYEGYVDIE